MFESIDYRVVDEIATITLDRTERLNAFTKEMAAEFIGALDLADADEGVRAIIVTGAGRAFSAGADLTLGQAGMVGPESEAVERDFGGLMTLRLFDCVKPVIGAINGPAVGVGATILLAMDVRLCSARARFGFIFVSRGIVPESASSWFLPRIVGIATALRWCMSGSVVSADEAHASGLVSRVTTEEELMAAAHDMALSFKRGAPVSVALTRRMLWTMLGASHPMEAHRLDSHALKERGAAGDIQEGISSFLEKRAACFSDRIEDAPIGSLLQPWHPGPFA
ncbi:MAG: enoyl-CoA hydratase-related protein [Sphingobium sp.]